MRPLRCFFASLFVCALAAASACSASSSDPGSTVNAGGSTTSGGAAGAGALGGFGAQAGSLGVDSGFGGSDTTDSGLDGPVCGAVEHTAVQSPVDLFIMLDRSVSMLGPVVSGGDIWTNVVNAITAFVGAQEAQGIGVGFGYFPRALDEPMVCNIADYERPIVPIAPLPGVASAITDAMAPTSLRPLGNTPTSAALQGALQYAKTWAQDHPERTTIVVLATDGDPTQCEPTASALIAQFAADALAQAPKVFTFVIGIGDLGNLNPIAVSGGTRGAFIIDPTQQNVAQEMTQALLRIATSPLGCSFALPPSRDGTALDPKRVNVDFTPSDGTPKRELVQVANAGACSQTADGWYYDNPSQPTRIVICESTCNSFGAGSLDIVLGCQTRVPS